jgi:hypothetical protein
MAFYGKESVPNKICLNNKIIERTNDFTHLGYKLSFQGETDLLQKNTKYTSHRYHKCGFETNISTETYPNTPVQDFSTASPMLWKLGVDRNKR